jgi:PAS domain S-box-containing protein
MTTSKWLWLGFGVLTALLVAAMLSMAVQLRSVQGEVEAMDDVDRARHVATLEMQRDVRGFSLGMRTYLLHGPDAARQAAARDAAVIDRGVAQYQRLAVTEHQRDLGRRFEVRWRELAAYGQRFIAGPAGAPATVADLDALDSLRRPIDTLLEQEMQVDALTRYESRRVATIAGMHELMRLALLMLLLGTLVAVATGTVVARRIVAGERRLASSAEQLQATLASIGDAVITSDLHGRVASLNPVAESLTGWSRTEAAGMPIDEVFRIVGESSREPVENPAQRALRDGCVTGLPQHTVLIARDGTGRPIDDSAAPIRDREGRIAGAVLVFRDISRRRHDEQARDASTRSLRELMDLLPGAIYTTDAQGRLLQYNPAAVAFSGRVPELGSDAWFRDWTLYGPDGAPLPPAQYPMRRVLERGQATGGDELVLEREDGLHLWFEAYSTPRLDDEGRVVGALHLLLDVTPRKETDAALKMSELRYRHLFESATDGIVLLDAATARITDANPRICALLGLAHAELVGRELWQVGLFEERDDCQAALRTLRRERVVRCADMPLRTRHGQRIDVEFVSNVYGKAPQEVMQCNIRDITERKTATAALREASQRKSEFLAMLAHELRNPLAPVRSALEILVHAGGDAGTQRSAIETMQRQVAHMVRMVDDLLDVSRVERGSIELRRRHVDLSDVVRQSAEVVRPLFDRLQHRFSVTLPPQPIYVDADATRLSQVFGNLLNNACKFTRTGGGHVELTVEREAAHAVISVRDNGVGIAADQLARVFELFVQVDTSLERSAHGLGIGLTLVRTLVELHGGSVQATSAGIGRGSEFVIRLPTLDAAAVQADAGAPEPRVQPHAARAPRRILVVDDNRDATESLMLLLQLDGHETRAAYDGPEALDAAQAFQPEIVLLDIGLPGLNGYEVARCLRQRPGGEHLLLVALTGWGQDDDRERTRAAGFDEHLVKPVDPALLDRVLARAGKGGATV